MSLTDKKAIHHPHPFSTGDVYGLESLTIPQDDQPAYDIFVPPEGKPLAPRRALLTQINPWGEEVEAAIGTEQGGPALPDPGQYKDLAHTHYLEEAHRQDGDRSHTEPSEQKWYSSTRGSGLISDSVASVEDEVSERQMVEVSDSVPLQQAPISDQPVDFNDQQWMSRLAKTDHLLNALNHSNLTFDRFDTDNTPDFSPDICFLEDSPLLEKVPSPKTAKAASFSGNAVKRPEKRKADQELADLQRVQPDIVIHQQIEERPEAVELTLETATGGANLDQLIDLPEKKGEYQVTTKVTATSSVSPDQLMDCTVHAPPTAVSRVEEFDQSTEAIAKNPAPDPLEVIRLSPHLDQGKKGDGPGLEIKSIMESESPLVVRSGQESQPTLEAEPTEQPEAEAESPVQLEPEAEPTEQPQPEPEAEPTEQPEAEPTVQPEAEPTVQPEAEPTEQPEAELTEQPEPEPEAEPAEQPEPVEELISDLVFEDRSQRASERALESAIGISVVKRVREFNPLDELTLDELTLDESPANQSEPMRLSNSTDSDQSWDKLGQEHTKPNPPRRSRRDKAPHRSPKKRPVKPVSQKKNSTPALASKKVGFYFYAGMNVLRRISASAIEGYLSSVTLDDKSRNHYYMERGVHYFNVGHIRRAAQYFESILDSHPEVGEVKARLGLCYLEMKKLEKAVVLLEQAQAHGCALDLDEKLALAYSHQGDDVKAVEKLAKALQNFPNKFELHYRLGVSLDNLEEYPEAARSFENALEIDPKNVKVCRLLGYAYERGGDREKAVAYFKKAKQLENDRLDHFVGDE
ncbi:MAG: tetratricopeptide repeat protein [Magnetococcales bacterium]|nr:tetratricopeptide repeat protein [Magnetococcales bacterium]